MAERKQFQVAAQDAGQRLDKFLAAHLPDFSRTRLAELIDAGHVRVNGLPAKRAHLLAPGQRVEVELVPRPGMDAVPEDLPLEILYQDEDLLVLNKPANMVVHVGAGHRRGTLVNALLHHFGQLSQLGGAHRPGIVHRLDINTSGALVVARHDAAHRHLAAQFQARTVEKIYVALVHGRVPHDSGTIALRISRDLIRRTRMTTRRVEGRDALTEWRVLARWNNFTLLAIRLHTGRTHQIRVHFSAIGCPVVGDVLYGAPRRIRLGSRFFPPLARNFLHAARISFDHPRTQRRVTVVAPLPPELRDFLARLGAELGEDHAAALAAIDVQRLNSLEF
ncbi:MAG TPA: RluA family pseudouridine synthase [Candidatus Nitrosotenuis sp.]|nr:RluA family pseudouridine synthase [Candidatus Nitrosotenuis sp.]